MNVLNIRLKRRGARSGPPSTGHFRPSRSTMFGSRLSVSDRLFRAGQLVEPEAQLVSGALDQRIAERLDVAGRHPHLGVHQDAGIEADDVVALLDHGPPPGALDVVLELDAERAVVPHGVDAAVDLRAGKHEAAPLGERHDGVEVGDGGRRIGQWSVKGSLLAAPALAWPVAGTAFSHEERPGLPAGPHRLARRLAQ